MDISSTAGAIEPNAFTAIPPGDVITVEGASGIIPSISEVGPTEGGKAGEGGTQAVGTPTTPSLPPLGLAGIETSTTDAKPAATKPPVADRSEPSELANDVGQRQVYFPKASINPVLQALQGGGWYLNSLGKGMHSLVCPRVDTHPDAQAYKTIYIEPNATFPAGQLFCQHEHEEGISLNDLLAFLGVNYSEARHRSCIRFVQGELSAVLHAIETELTKLGRFFHMQGTMVAVGVDAHGNTVVTPVTEQMLTQVLATHIDFEKYDGRIKGFAPCDPQPRYVNMLLNKRDFEILPQLNGIARQPYFLPPRNGLATLCVKDGYNSASGLLGAFRGQDYVLPEPTLENAMEALALLLDLICEFHFVSPLDRSVALSAMFTGVFRASIGLAPGFHVRAPVPASGKSLLCQLTGLFAGPESNKKISYPKSSEEATKVILSALLGSPAVIEFDDMTHDWLAHGVINRLFTSEHITDRILGVSKMATVATKILILGSGNNVGPIRDLCRRVLTCNLDPRCDNPAALSYQRSPVELVRKNRAKYVGAVLTIVHAWMAAGSPKTDVSNIASFGGDWADYCRHPLIWLGMADPADAFFEQLKKDPDVEILGRLLRQWHKAFGSTPKTLRAAVDALHTYPDLQDAIAEFPVFERGEVNRSKFGWLLKRNANRIVDGLMFERIDASERTAWSVVRTDDNKSNTPALPPSPPLVSPDPFEATFSQLDAFDKAPLESKESVTPAPAMESQAKAAHAHDDDTY